MERLNQVMYSFFAHIREIEKGDILSPFSALLFLF